jgi:hypothetical protein
MSVLQDVFMQNKNRINLVDDVGKPIFKGRVNLTLQEAINVQQALNDAEYWNASNWYHATRKYKGKVRWYLYCKLPNTNFRYFQSSLIFDWNEDITDFLAFKAQYIANKFPALSCVTLHP